MAYAIFRKVFGDDGIEMLFDESWDHLKIEACKKWDIELDFDASNSWTKLRAGELVVHANMGSAAAYQAWNQANGDYIQFFTQFYEANELTYDEVTKVLRK